MESCLYEGKVRHRRFAPVDHAFSYKMYMVYIDLAEAPQLFRRRWLWSSSGRNVAEFRRSDYHGPVDLPLDEAVRRTVHQETGERPTGPIRMLTHLRYFGYIFNPVTFYYVYDAEGIRVQTIMAEITNTPWGERRAYVLDASRNVDTSDRRHRFKFRKDFHVSPFLGMDYDYDWRFSDPGGKLAVHMENFQQGRRHFDATMTLRRVEMTSQSLARVLLHYPFMTGRVIGAIYWQALRLWIKGVPFHGHPESSGEIDRKTPREKAFPQH